MANLKGMNIEALMKLRNQVDETMLAWDRGRRGNWPRNHRPLLQPDQSH